MKTVSYNIHWNYTAKSTMATYYFVVRNVIIINVKNKKLFIFCWNVINTIRRNTMKI